MKKYLSTVAAVGLVAGLSAANAQTSSPGSSMKQPETAAPTQSTPSIGASGNQEPAKKSAPQGSGPSAQSTQPAGASGTNAGSGKMGDSSDPKVGTPADAKKTGTASDTKGGAPSNTKTGAASDTKTGAPSTTTGAAPSGSASLTTEQRTEIRTKVLAGAPRVTNVNFSLNVGTVVPRTVNFVAVPSTLIEIHPEWRPYRYFVVKDQIVIIDPVTYRIIAILEV